MKVKSEKGVSLILLIIVVVILIVLAIFGIKYIKEKVETENIEDIKSYMLSIQALTKNIQNKHVVNEEENSLIGIAVNLENNETEYKISDELKEELTQIENSNLYIITQEDLDNNGLSKIKINNDEFYVVDYNSGEIYYSKGIDGKYSLKEIDPKDDVPQKNEEENVEVVEGEGAENEGTGDWKTK